MKLNLKLSRKTMDLNMAMTVILKVLGLKLAAPPLSLICYMRMTWRNLPVLDLVISKQVN